LEKRLEVFFVCASTEVYDYLQRAGFSLVKLTDTSRLVEESASQKPSLLLWDASRLLRANEVAYIQKCGAFIIEFDAHERKSHADEVVSGFERTLCGVSGRSYRLIGPDYFVVDSNFSNAKQWRRTSPFLHNRPDLFVCFSGEESELLLQSVLETLTDIPACRSLQIHAVAGFKGNKGRDIERSFSTFKNVRVYTEEDASLVARLMRFSSLGIVSFGPLVVEAMAAELPVLTINTREGERQYAEKVFQGIFAGAGISLGSSSSPDWTLFRRGLTWLLQSPQNLERMKVATRGLVDGQGAQRITRYIAAYIQSMQQPQERHQFEDLALQIPNRIQ
jgi:spore coat polysaccharide biosynthesis predicted glycosyltransferase SpsG